MAVAQRVHGDARGKVQVTSAVRRVEVVAFSAFEHDVLATVRRHHSRNHVKPPPKEITRSPTTAPRRKNRVYERGRALSSRGEGVSTWSTVAARCLETAPVPLLGPASSHDIVDDASDPQFPAQPAPRRFPVRDG